MADARARPREALGSCEHGSGLEAGTPLHSSPSSPLSLGALGWSWQRGFPGPWFPGRVWRTVSGEEGTVREKIIRVLMETRSPLSAQEIAVLVGLDPRTGEKEVYQHLRHIAKTVRRKSGGRLALYMVPPRCRDCGYVFQDLREPRKPSKCPRCRSQRIEPPRFYIAEA